jgi:hypothetical protein
MGSPFRVARLLLAPILALVVWPVCAGAQESLAPQDPYAPRDDWSSFSRRDINISGFVFRDVNRNGTYDLADRPMEDVAVKMTSFTGDTVIRQSNSNGFANFSMSVHQRDADIAHPGEYAFDVLIPNGWSLTTDNRKQVKQFRVLPGSIADIVADPPFVAVGLAQNLVIRGQIAEGGAGAELTISDPAGATHVVSPQSDGSFSFPVTPGRWVLRARDPGSTGTIERAIDVQAVPVQLSRIVFGQPERPQGRILSIVDFESVTEKSIREMPNGVGGLNWWNVVVLEVAPGYTNGAQSGYHVAYNSSGHPARIYHDAPFDFVGGFFAVAWARANGETLHLRAWRGDELVNSDTIVLSNLGSVWFDADYRGITRLDLHTERYWQFVSDDLTFRLNE